MPHYRRFQFHKRTQLFIGVHNETLSIGAIARQQRRSFFRENPTVETQPTPTGSAGERRPARF
jgi:hypothetical protein